MRERKIEKAIGREREDYRKEVNTIRKRGKKYYCVIARQYLNLREREREKANKGLTKRETYKMDKIETNVIRTRKSVDWMRKMRKFDPMDKKGCQSFRSRQRRCRRCRRCRRHRQTNSGGLR